MNARRKVFWSVVILAASLAVVGEPARGGQKKAEKADPKPVVLNGHTGVSTLAWRPDGKTLATAAASGDVQLWDPTTGEATATVGTCGGGCRAIAWRPDGKALAAAGDDGPVRVWPVPAPK